MSEEEITTLEIKVPKETIQWIEENAKSDDIDIENVVNRMLSDGFTLAYIDAEESVVKLGYVDAWGKLKHGSNLEEVKEEFEAYRKQSRERQEQLVVKHHNELRKMKGK